MKKKQIEKDDLVLWTRSPILFTQI
jgi:hypothetical protein